MEKFGGFLHFLLCIGDVENTNEIFCEKSSNRYSKNMVKHEKRSAQLDLNSFSANSGTGT